MQCRTANLECMLPTTKGAVASPSQKPPGPELESIGLLGSERPGSVGSAGPHADSRPMLGDAQGKW